MSRVSNHLRSNVVGYVAVFIALSGTAYAVDGPLPGQDQVGSGDIINGEVLSVDVRGDQIFASDVRDDTLPNGGLGQADIAAGAIGGSEVQNAALDAADIANTNTLGTAEINEASLAGVNAALLGGLAPADIVVKTVSDTADSGECTGSLPDSVNAETCVDTFLTLSRQSDVFVVATGLWHKLSGDSASANCQLSADNGTITRLFRPGLIRFGDNSNFGGGHIDGFGMPFTFQGSEPLAPASYDIELTCGRTSGADSDVDSAFMSVYAFPTN